MWLLVIGTYLAYFDRFVSSAGATFLKTELGLSDAGFGLLAGTLFAIAYASGAVIFGHLSRNRSAMPFLIGGMMIWTTGIVGLAYAASAEHFAIAQIVVGIGQAAFIPAAIAVITSTSTPLRIGRVTSRFSIASSLGRSSAALTTGAIIAAIAATLVAAPFGLPAAWRATFLLTSLPNLVLIAALFLMLRRSGGATAPFVPLPRPTRLVTRAQLALFAAACAVIVVIQSTAIWFPTLLVRLHAVEPAKAAILTGIVTLVTAPMGQLFGGRLLDRMSPRGLAPTHIVMGGIAVGGVALATLIGSPPLPHALVLLGVANLSLGIASVSALAGIQRVTPGSDRHRINGYFFATVTLVGLGTGPALTGMLSDAGSDPATALPRALAIVAAAMFGLAMAAHLFAQTTRDKS